MVRPLCELMLRSRKSGNRDNRLLAPSECATNLYNDSLACRRIASSSP
jgi:hypothetical protein